MQDIVLGKVISMLDANFSLNNFENLTFENNIAFFFSFFLTFAIAKGAKKSAGLLNTQTFTNNTP